MEEYSMNQPMPDGLNDEAAYLEQHSDFSSDEARTSLLRGFKHYLDLGEPSDRAWDRARELVALAVESARRSGFGLLGSVDHLLFSEHHRVQSGFGR